MGSGQGPSKLAVLQIAVASSLPFLPALSEDLVFDDLPAVARNKDISASTPVPIFMVSIITCDFIVDVKLRNLLYSRINALFYISQVFSIIRLCSPYTFWMYVIQADHPVRNNILQKLSRTTIFRIQKKRQFAKDWSRRTSSKKFKFGTTICKKGPQEQQFAKINCFELTIFKTIVWN